MTIEELAADLNFDPATTGLVGDFKPWGRGPRPKDRRKWRVHTACKVCGVGYSPAGVCGYCRAKVKAIRAARVVQQSQAG